MGDSCFLDALFFKSVSFNKSLRQTYHVLLQVLHNQSQENVQLARKDRLQHTSVHITCIAIKIFWGANRDNVFTSWFNGSVRFVIIKCQVFVTFVHLPLCGNGCIYHATWENTNREVFSMNSRSLQMDREKNAKMTALYLTLSCTSLWRWDPSISKAANIVISACCTLVMLTAKASSTLGSPTLSMTLWKMATDCLVSLQRACKTV